MNYKESTIHILNKFGIDERYKGFHYIISSIISINENGTNALPITKFLYADIAKAYNTSKECVERDIRKTIELIWNKSNNVNLIIKIFGQENVSKRLSNSNFILLLYKYIKVQNNKEMRYPLFEDTCKFTCPILGTTCEFSNSFIREIIYTSNSCTMKGEKKMNEDSLVTYKVVKETMTNEDNVSYMAYGIEYSFVKDGRMIFDRITDISTNLSFIESLVKKFNELHLSNVHFRDAVYDAICERA